MLLPVVVASFLIAKPDNFLAVELVAPTAGEVAIMENDRQLLNASLKARGLPERDILYRRINATSDLEEMVGEARRRIASWKSGTLVFYYSGHGAVTDLQHPEAGLVIPPFKEDIVYPWRKVFAGLAPPSGVHVLLLPDC